MPKIKVKAKTFNGLEITPEIDVFVNYGKKDKNLYPWVYNNIKEKIKEKFNVKEFEFEIVSKDLELLKSMGTEIIWDDFSEKILRLIKDVNKEVENSALKRAYAFYKDGDKKRAREIFESINKKELNEFDRDEYRFLEFLLDENKTEDKFKEIKEYFKENPVKLKEIYFDFIKYLQDKRDEKLPKHFLEEFESTFSINDLSEKEKSIYFYLKGRNFYYRGEFIDAIRNLKKAKEYAVDEEMLGNIYNTAANIFTDNFYFDEAFSLADKALQIRKRLHLEEKEKDTLSLIGGIYLKQNRLNKAYEYFKKVKREDSRINNYRAKTAILRGYLNKAYEYIQKAKEYEAMQKEPDKKGFVRGIEMFYLFKKGEFEKAKEFFAREFVLPEKRKGVDAIVWGLVYSILSEIYFKEGKKEDMYKSLFKGIDKLLDDNYVIEAYYLSLYPVKFGMEQKDIDEFNKKISMLNLNSKLLDYVNRHSEVLKKEAKEFGIEIKSDNLRNFYKNLVEKKDFDKYNLF
jgi:hypothetical protein